MSSKKSDRRGLGRGLSALMSDVAPISDAPEAATSRRPDLMIPVEAIHPNPNQPRRDFSKESLDELAASIREKGVIQPLIVRPRPDAPKTYEIVAGERRWRAAQLAQQHEVPVLVRDMDDAEVLEIAIIENIQRADLNAIEEALAYRQLIDRFGHTQEKLASGLSKSRSHIANQMRLLHLPEEVQSHIREGRLTAGHARALITSNDPLDLARRVIAGGLSVRETEKLAKADKPATPKSSAQKPQKDADTRVLEQDLSAALGMRVAIDHKGHDGGNIVITYKSLDQLDQICQVLNTGG